MLLAGRAIFNEVYVTGSRAGVSLGAQNLLEAHVFDVHGGKLQPLSLKSATFDKHFPAWKIPHQKLKAMRVSISAPDKNEPGESTNLYLMIDRLVGNLCRAYPKLPEVHIEFHESLVMGWLTNGQSNTSYRKLDDGRSDLEYCLSYFTRLRKYEKVAIRDLLPPAQKGTNKMAPKIVLYTAFTQFQ
jgi:hypothetical protein